MAKTLIISVGGSLSPIICSIKFHQPENIIFFCSVETEPQIAEILRHIDLASIRHIEKIVSESAENINFSLKAILSKVPEILARWKIKVDEVIVDYTGGTKSMSSALVLGTIDYTKCFSYVGAKDEKSRNKDGIGVVIDGYEKVITLKNPWDELAIDEKKRISLLFNSGRYRAAWEVSLSAKEKVSDKQIPFFSLLAQFCEVYYKWDSFKYENAHHNLKKVLHDAEIMCFGLPDQHSLAAFLERSKGNLKFLNVIIYGTETESEKYKKDLSFEEKRMIELKKGEYRLLDLLANAKRRAQQENRYDDALVRLYRALEKRAQLELQKYDLDASDIKLELVPEKLKEELKLKYYNERKNKIEIPLYATYWLLKALEEDRGTPGIGHRFFDQYEAVIGSIIDLRNKNIIVHGDVLADENKFNEAWANCLAFLEINEDELPVFPRLEF